MYEFAYHQPKSLDEAAAFLRENDEAKLLAGGMTLLATMKQRLAQPSDILDISELLERGITDEGTALRIGAGTCHAEVAGNLELAAHLPALAYLADRIGDPMIRNRGTVGGALANNDPAADYPAAVLALGGVIHTLNRDIPASEFFVDMFETALEPDEIITAISLQKPLKAGYAKFPQPASGYAIAGVFVAHFGDGVRVAVTGAAPCVYRQAQLETALDIEFSVEAIRDIVLPSDGLLSDLHADSAYRAALVHAMAQEAVKQALHNGG